MTTPLRSDNQSMVVNSYEEVATTTLDAFNEPVDFIKMDIEGMEDKALRGAYFLFEKYKPICFVEIYKTDVDFLVKFFTEMGYVGFRKDADLIAIPVHHQVQMNGLDRIF